MPVVRGQHFRPDLAWLGLDNQRSLAKVKEMLCLALILLLITMSCLMLQVTANQDHDLVLRVPTHNHKKFTVLI